MAAEPMGEDSDRDPPPGLPDAIESANETARGR